MYDKLLEDCEDIINNTSDRLNDYKIIGGLLDSIIKIKTIKYMDLQTEILEASRRVSLN